MVQAGPRDKADTPRGSSRRCRGVMWAWADGRSAYLDDPEPS
jgi:hypothetical protein